MQGFARGASVRALSVIEGELETVQKPLPEAGSIIVAVKDGIVTLNGEVPSLTHKCLAGVLAWWVPGTGDVISTG